jgi:hypothetical protein
MRPILSPLYDKGLRPTDVEYGISSSGHSQQKDSPLNYV